MTTPPPPDADLPSWGGITEPMTVLTNLVLAAIALIFSARLGYQASAEGLKASGALAGALMATALAAVLGAIAHGLDPRVEPELRQRMWRGSLYLTGFIGVGAVASVAYFAARDAARGALLLFALVKLMWFIVAVTRRPEFRVAATDYSIALAILFGGAAYALVQWSEPGSSWLMAGVLVSFAAGVVQARRVAFHRHFNHNDLFHVIQIVTLYLFYRGAAQLVDR